MQRILLIVFLVAQLPTVFADDGVSPPLRIMKYAAVSLRPSEYRAFYVSPEDESADTEVMLNDFERSTDGGIHWQPSTITPDFAARLPFGYRRYRATEFVGPSGRLVGIYNALDTSGLNPKTREPAIALKTYYLRYRVSTDAGNSWLFDARIVGEGSQSAQQPFDGLKIGNNCFFIGDLGCRPIVTDKGTILVPAQMTLQGKKGKLSNPGGGHTYTDALILRGKWTDYNRIEWTAADRVQGDPAKSTRGMIEPTLAQLVDGRIMMVMRGSNDVKQELPARRWFSLSSDDGKTWTKPAVWKYSNGNDFYSPSAMSSLVKHSSGRVFWVGNITAENSAGNLPRWPVVIAEVDRKSLQLIERSKLLLDTKGPRDIGRKRLSLCHFTCYEDRTTNEIVISFPRSFESYRRQEWAVVRVAVQ